MEVRTPDGEVKRRQFYEAAGRPRRRRACASCSSWDSDNTDLDLHVVGPDGSHVFYGDRVAANGGALDVDVTTGFGPEIFATQAPLTGLYHVYVNYYGAGDRRDVITTAQVAIIQDEGTPREKQQVFQVPMRKPGELTLVRSFLVGTDARRVRPPRRRALPPHPQEPVGAVDRQRRPDQHEADQPRRLQRLAEPRDAQQELDRRRQVLQRAERGQRDAARAGGEQQQRDRGERAGEQQPADGGAVHAGEQAGQAAVRRRRPRQRDQRHRRDARPSPPPGPPARPAAPSCAAGRSCRTSAARPSAIHGGRPSVAVSHSTPQAATATASHCSRRGRSFSTQVPSSTLTSGVTK